MSDRSQMRLPPGDSVLVWLLVAGASWALIIWLFCIIRSCVR